MSDYVHIYVFSHWVKGIPVYDCTCGSERAALARLRYRDRQGYRGGVYTVGWVPKKFFS